MHDIQLGEGKSDEKMQLRCCAYDTNDHVRQHRLAYNFCARPRGMGDVFLEPHQLEIKNCFKKTKHLEIRCRILEGVG